MWVTCVFLSCYGAFRGRGCNQNRWHGGTKKRLGGENFGDAWNKQAEKSNKSTGGRTMILPLT